MERRRADDAEQRRKLAQETLMFSPQAPASSVKPPPVKLTAAPSQSSHTFVKGPASIMGGAGDAARVTPMKQPPVLVKTTLPANKTVTKPGGLVTGTGPAIPTVVTAHPGTSFLASFSGKGAASVKEATTTQPKIPSPLISTTAPASSTVFQKQSNLQNVDPAIPTGLVNQLATTFSVSLAAKTAATPVTGGLGAAVKVSATHKAPVAKVKDTTEITSYGMDVQEDDDTVRIWSIDWLLAWLGAFCSIDWLIEQSTLR